MADREPGEERRPASWPPSGLTWNRSDGLRGLVLALPAGVVTAVDPAAGLPLALGVLPATMVALPAARRARVRLMVVGAICGGSLFLGGALSHLPVPVGALALFLVVVGTAVSSSRAPAGLILLTLAAPLTAAGLSFTDWSSAGATFLLMLVGSAFAWVVSLAWPELPPAPTRDRRLPDRSAMLGYGIRMGTAGAIAYVLSGSLGLDHPGWAPAACLLVARPNVDLLQSRGVGRVLAVTAGALLGAAVANSQAPAWSLGVTAMATLALAAGLRTSRWYITSLFTTYLVVLMLLYAHPEETAQKVTERISETLLGVALAYAFGWLLPALMTSARGPGRRREPDGA